ncbi:MAG: cobyrinate a,c-diamide synthase [Methanotrichaceae archaeon]|nr:cobyrinate a,c-diamide synthase [Methanotrichaceae archaeon]
MIPAMLIAGTHSGVGKTTVALGLMAALHSRGLQVQPFKVGPDFIDPSHHTDVCGRVSRNLDAFMMGLDGIEKCFCRGIKDADVAIVEGVMGLYDGINSSEKASTAEVAKALRIPVLLVLDAQGMSRSAGAVEMGYTCFDSKVNIAGIILNRVGSTRHLAMLKGSIKSPILGALPKSKDIETKSRHLGLVMGFERKHDIAALSSFIEKHLDLDAILELRCNLCSDQESHEIRNPSVRIGIADDEAFCFYYRENLEELQKLGAELVLFSPIRDDLPDIDGLYIGGGYPELYVEALEKGIARKQIKKASENGMPIYGECGGLIYLSRQLVSDNARSYEMVNALPCITLMTKKLQALGYVEAQVVGSNPIVDIGKTIRGHEFHYSQVEPDKDAHFAYRIVRGKGIKNCLDGLIEQNTLGSYLHTHFYSHHIDKFIDSCKSYHRK